MLRRGEVHVRRRHLRALSDSPSLLIEIHYPCSSAVGYDRPCQWPEVHKFRATRRREGETQKGWQAGRNKVALCSAGGGDGPWLILKTLYYLFKKLWSWSCTHRRSPETGFCIDLRATTAKIYGLLLFFLSVGTFFFFPSCPGRSLRAGCVLNISQWWLILWAAARSWVEGFWFHRQILQLLSAAPESSLQSLFISLYLCLSAPLFYLFCCCQSLCLSPDSCL